MASIRFQTCNFCKRKIISYDAAAMSPEEDGSFHPSRADWMTRNFPIFLPLKIYVKRAPWLLCTRTWAQLVAAQPGITLCHSLPSHTSESQDRPEIPSHVQITCPNTMRACFLRMRSLGCAFRHISDALGVSQRGNQLYRSQRTPLVMARPLHR